MNNLNNNIISSLEDIKAQNITVININEISTLTDCMIVCSGTSDRHVIAIAKSLISDLKQKGFDVNAYEGLSEGEWVLIDAGDAIIHIMKPETRDYYQLEKLWHSAPQEIVGAAAVQ